MCRAARFCNGAAHGGQVVGPSAIVPGLLQAWGCEKTPDGQIPGIELQVKLHLHHYQKNKQSRKHNAVHVFCREFCKV